MPRQSEPPAGPRGWPQKATRKVVAGPDDGGSVRDGGERSLEQIKGGLQGGDLQGARREDMRPAPGCWGANAERGAQEAAGSVGAAWLPFGPLSLHRPRTRSVPAWSGRRGPTQQPPLAPPGTGQEDRGSRRASPQVKDHALWLSVAVFSAGPSIPTLGQQPSPWEGGMLPNRKHEPRTCPPAAPPGPSLPPSPNSHSRDGPEQR